MHEKYASIVEKNKNKGVYKGGIFLLRPSDALDFLDDLRKNNIGVYGIELWYFLVDEDYMSIVENPFGPDYSALSSTPNFVEESISRAKDDIIHHLPHNTAFVSFVV